MVNSRQRRTLQAIFQEPTRADLSWREIESLFDALGAEVREGKGSRVRVLLNGVAAVFHRPHPRPAAGKGAVESVREFLIRARVRIPSPEAEK
jgi:hypothetical protein